jgi:UDP-glucose 4-epimerase
MKIAIFGGCGFVGRRFVRRLAAEGHTITCVDNMFSGVSPEDWLFPAEGKIAWHYQDVRDWFRGTNASTFDLVIHCAAIVGGRRIIDGDPLMLATNLSIDSQLFDWITHERNRFGLIERAKKMPKLIYFSSSAVYPAELQTEKNNMLLNEKLVDFSGQRFSLPEGSYGFCKFAGEYLAKQAVDHYGLDVVIYRPFGGYGEDQSLDYPLPSIVRRVVAKENPITIWGSGNQQRDFIYIEDVVEAVLATYNRMPSGEAVNLGTGLGYSFFDIAEFAADIEGYDGLVRNDPSKPEGVFRRVADAHKLSQWYEPTTMIKDGLRKVIEHIKQGLTLAKQAM